MSLFISRRKMCLPLLMPYGRIKEIQKDPFMPYGEIKEILKDPFMPYGKFKEILFFTLFFQKKLWYTIQAAQRRDETQRLSGGRSDGI